MDGVGAVAVVVAAAMTVALAMVVAVVLLVSLKNVNLALMPWCNMSSEPRYRIIWP